MRIIFFLVILSTSVSYSQYSDQEVIANMRYATEKYDDLIMAKNFFELSNFASPKLIEHLKSKQDFVYLLTQLSESAEAQGITITDISFGDPSEVFEHGNELQSVVPFKLSLEDEEKIVEIGSGIALISFNKGKNWYFTFQVKKNKAENNRILGLNEKIIIPARTQNVVIK